MHALKQHHLPPGNGRIFMKNPADIQINVQAGVSKLVKPDKNQNIQKLTAELKDNEACIVFHAVYDNHEGLKDSSPTIMMVHWSKESGISLSRQLLDVIDENSGIGFLHDIQVSIVVRPGTTDNFVNDIRKAIAGLSGQLFLNKNIKADSAKIPCVELAKFCVNSFGKPVAIVQPESAARNDHPQKKGSSLLGAFRKLI